MFTLELFIGSTHELGRLRAVRIADRHTGRWQSRVVII
jgi:hypothetical protein